MNSPKSIDLKSPLPKSYQLQQILLENIKNGTWKVGSKLPTVTELKEQYSISWSTISTALRRLSEKGYLETTQGKGIFVTEQKEEIRGENIAGLFLPTRGHLFGEFSRLLIQGLQSIGYYSLVFDTSSLKSQSEEGEKKIENFLNTRLTTLIVDGSISFPSFKLLCEKKKNLNTLIFIFRLETSFLFPEAIKVLSDFKEGGYLVVKHLLNLGHKKILLFTYALQPEPYLPAHSLLAGCNRAFGEKGLDYKNSLLIEIDEEQAKKNEEKLTKILSRSDRPTAIFAIGDHRAKDIFSVTQKLQISIPKDLAIVGYFNTPWCERFDVPLTSVSIEEETIVNVVKDILAGTKDYSGKEAILVKPKLIIRSSCGANKSERKEQMEDAKFRGEV